MSELHTSTAIKNETKHNAIFYHIDQLNIPILG
jgi:hypothetical protein